MVKFRINWALPNSLNAANEHSDWYKLESLCYEYVCLFLGFTIKVYATII